MNKKTFPVEAKDQGIGVMFRFRMDSFSSDHFYFIVSFQFSHNFTSSNSTFWGARTRDPTSSRDNTIGHKRKSN